MGKCLSRPKKNRTKTVTIAVFGIDKAGKSSVVKVLQGESRQDVVPTIGFSTSKMKWKRVPVTLLDVGGGERIRDIWKNYYAESHGIVYVVDSSDPQRIRESADQFSNLVSDNRIQGKPMLLLLNKQDVNGAVDETQAADQMKLEPLVNANKCPCKVEMISTTTGSGKHMDTSLNEGFTWLINYITAHYQELSNKISRDMEIQKDQLDREKEQRLKRIRKAQEKRELLGEDEEGEKRSKNEVPDKTDEKTPSQQNGSISSVPSVPANRPSELSVDNLVNGHLPSLELSNRSKRRVRPLSAGHGTSRSATLTSTFQTNVTHYLPPIVSPPNRRPPPRLPTSVDIPPPPIQPPSSRETGRENGLDDVPPSRSSTTTFPQPPVFVDAAVIDAQGSPRERKQSKERRDGARRKRRKRRLQRFNRTAPSNDTDLPGKLDTLNEGDSSQPHPTSHSVDTTTFPQAQQTSHHLNQAVDIDSNVSIPGANVDNVSGKPDPTS